MDTYIFPKTAKLAGTAKETSWSQVFLQEAQQPEIAQARGQLFAVLEIRAGGEFSAANAGRETWEKLASSYFGQDTGEPLETLETSLGAASAEIEKQMHESTLNDKEQWRFALIAAALWGKVLYLAAIGGAKAQLVRNSAVQTVISSQPKILSEPAKIELASGYAEEGDLLILGSAGFAEIIDLANLQTAIQQTEVEEMAATLAPKIHSLADSSTVAALFIKLAMAVAPTPEEEGIVFAQAEVEQPRLVEQEGEREKVKEWFKVVVKLKRLFAQIKLKFFTRGASLYLREQRFDRKKRQKFILSLLLILLLLFTVSVFWGLSRRGQMAKRAQFTALFEEAIQLYDQGQGLLELNPGKARENFQDSAKVLAEIKLIGLEKGKVKELEAKISEGLLKSLQLVTIDNPVVFLDLNLVKNGAAGSKIAGFDKTLVVWDMSGKSVLSINAETKSAAVVAGGSEITAGKLLAAGNDFAYVYTDNDGIWRINLRDKSKKKVIEKENAWGEIVDIYSYAGNIYLLDRVNNQVHKYAAARDGYGPLTGFIVDEAEKDLSQAKSLAIDGLIWVISGNGEISKLLGGRVERLELTGLDKPIADAVAVDGDERAKYLYILDKAGKRVVVATKEGQYWSQYVSEAFVQASDLAVDEPAKKMFVLAQNKIFVIDLK